MPSQEKPIQKDAVGLAIRELRADRQLSLETVSERETPRMVLFGVDRKNQRV